MKKNIAILCGGQSVEHDISLLSASNVVKGLDRQRYTPIVIYITRDGRWHWIQDCTQFIAQAQAMQLDYTDSPSVLIRPGEAALIVDSDQSQLSLDCVFPILHGANGEDGTMQGLLTLLNVPFVGCGTLSAALCMEKHFSKLLAQRAGVSVLEWVLLSKGESPGFDALCRQLHATTLFMKTVASGSSLGVYKIASQSDYDEAIREAFTLDTHVIVEPAVQARELEVAVLGNTQAEAALPSEIVLHKDFYSFEAKYFDADTATVMVPAEISAALASTLQADALKIYKACRCTGLARVDFLVVSEDEVYFNEINPMPGFTNISVFPKSWNQAGVDYSQLLTRLIEFAEDEYRQGEQRRRAFDRLVQQKHERYHAN